MDILIWFDQFLIEVIFERFAHWFQRLTGKTCFWMARFSMCVLFVTIGIDIGVSLCQYKAADLLMNVIVGGFLISVIPGAIQKVERKVVPGVRNYLAIATWPVLIRSYSVITLMLNLIFFPALQKPPTGQVGYLALIMTIYFMSCTPLPPGKSKIKKWLESASQKWNSLWEPGGLGQPA